MRKEKGVDRSKLKKRFAPAGRPAQVCSYGDLCRILFTNSICTIKFKLKITKKMLSTSRYRMYLNLLILDMYFLILYIEFKHVI